MDRFRIALRVVGKGIDPDWVTEYTGVAPTDSYRAGDMLGKHGRAATRVRTHSGWFLGVESEDPAKFSEVLVAFLRQVPKDLADRALERDGEADLFVGLFGLRDQSTFDMEVEAMQELAERKLVMIFDMYT